MIRYEIRNGLRFVIPYSHQFTCFVKARWYQQPLIEVYAREFKAYSQAYYENAITTGKIHVNNKTVNL